MEAKLLRAIGRDRFCLMLCDTSAVVCAVCEVTDTALFAGMCKASPFNPLDVWVRLGDYNVGKGEFRNSEILLVGEIKKHAESTKYRRVCI